MKKSKKKTKLVKSPKYSTAFFVIRFFNPYLVTSVMHFDPQNRLRSDPFFAKSGFYFRSKNGSDKFRIGFISGIVHLYLDTDQKKNRRTIEQIQNKNVNYGNEIHTFSNLRN